MPLKLKVGLSRNIVGSNDVTLEATCHVEVELDEHQPVRDPEGFHRQIQQAFAACAEAMQESLIDQVPGR